MSSFLHFFQPHDPFSVLLILMVVVWGAGRIFKAFGLPPMLGEILSGVLIGPSVLGVLETNEMITVLAELGVFFLMFHSGLDTDARLFLKRMKDSVWIALGGIICVSGLSWGLLTWWEVPFLTKAFISAGLALNSIPVIVSVLKSFDLKNGPVGYAVLGASVFNEILLFIVLSVILVLAQEGTLTIMGLAILILKVLLFFVGTLFIGRKILPILSPHILNKTGSKGFTFALIVALFFGLLAEAIGLHVILGAYLAGMFVREEITNDKIMKKIEDRFYALSHSFLGPIFFASVGMMVDFSLLWQQWQTVLGLLTVLFIGQGVGSFFAARYLDYSKLQAGQIALSMSGRGSTEIIIAQIGFSTVVVTTGTTLLSEFWLAAIISLSFFSTLLMPLFLKLWSRQNSY